MLDKQAILNELPYFTGTTSYYRTMFAKVILTDGAHFVREACDAYWLIDAICTHLIGREAKDNFASVKFVVKDSAGVLTLDDGNGNVFAQQEIEYTDFPLDSINFYGEHDGLRWVLLLPSEH
ncbi:DUF6876 family protein [Paraburkholderia sp. BR14320]|uniref:DUF6876 family protein n=1 Tax=unclassified Paraburkholderia TaxID=2615204 RepID=UPI0034CF10E8